MYLTRSFVIHLIGTTIYLMIYVGHIAVGHTLLAIRCWPYVVSHTLLAIRCWPYFREEEKNVSNESIVFLPCKSRILDVDTWLRAPHASSCPWHHRIPIDLEIKSNSNTIASK